MLLKGAYCVGEHFVDPQCSYLFYFDQLHQHISFSIPDLSDGLGLKHYK